MQLLTGDQLHRRPDQMHCVRGKILPKIDGAFGQIQSVQVAEFSDVGRGLTKTQSSLLDRIQRAADTRCFQETLVCPSQRWSRHRPQNLRPLSHWDRSIAAGFPANHAREARLISGRDWPGWLRT